MLGTLPPSKRVVCQWSKLSAPQPLFQKRYCRALKTKFVSALLNLGVVFASLFVCVMCLQPCLHQRKHARIGNVCIDWTMSSNVVDCYVHLACNHCVLPTFDPNASSAQTRLVWEV